MKKRFFSVMLVFCMLLSMLPMMAITAGATNYSEQRWNVTIVDEKITSIKYSFYTSNTLDYTTFNLILWDDKIDNIIAQDSLKCENGWRALTLTIPANTEFVNGCRIGFYMSDYDEGLATPSGWPTLSTEKNVDFVDMADAKNVYVNGTLQSNKKTLDDVLNYRFLVTEGTVANGTISANKQTAAAGDTVTVTATPDAGFVLDKIFVNGTSIQGATFTMPKEDITVTAKFNPTVLTEITGKHIKSFTTTEMTSDYGDYFVALANDLFGETNTSEKPQALVFKSGLNNEGSVYNRFLLREVGESDWSNCLSYSNNSDLLKDATAYVLGTAVFDYKVTEGACENGSVDISGEYYAAGETVTVEAVPSGPYKPEQILVDGSPIVGTTFTMPAHAVTVTATFTKIQYTPNPVTTITDLSGKYVMSATFSQPVAPIEHETITEMFIDDANTMLGETNTTDKIQVLLCYKTEDGQMAGLVRYTEDMMGDNTTWFPEFVIEDIDELNGYIFDLGEMADFYLIGTAVFGYTLTAGDCKNGSITVSPEQGFCGVGTAITVTATPDTGFALDKVFVNGTAITGTSFEMPAEDVTVTATFVSAAATTPMDDAAFAASLTLNNSMDVTLRIKNVTLSDEQFAKLVVTADDKTVTMSNGTAAISGTIASKAPFAMGDAVHVVVTYDGAKIADFNYSVKTYCDAVLASGSTGTNFKNLATAVLNYGAWAQKYANYETENLVNANVIDNTESVVISAPESVVNKTDFFTGCSASLMLSSDTDIDFVLRFSEPITKEDFYIENNLGERVLDKNIYFAQYMNGCYFITIQNIGASKVSRNYTIKLTADDSVLLSYGVANYCADIQTQSDNANLKGLCKALYNYGAVATTYLANPNA